MSYTTDVSADDQRSFELFRKAVDALHQCGLLRNTEAFKVDLFSTVEATQLNEINSDELKSFLTSIRHFTLSDDKANFYYIHGLLRKNCTDENMLNWVEYAKGLWRSTMSSRPFIFEGQTDHIDVEKSLNLHFYSGVAHFRDEQTKEMEELPAICKDFITMGIFHAFHALIHALNVLDIAVDLFQQDTAHTAAPFPTTEA